MYSLSDREYDREQLAWHLENSSLHHAQVRVGEEQDFSVVPGVYIYGETRYDFRAKPRSAQERWMHPRALSFSIEVQPGDDGFVVPFGIAFVATAYFKDLPVESLQKAQSIVDIYGGRICGYREMWVTKARYQMWLGEAYKELRQLLVDRSAQNMLLLSVRDARTEAHNRFIHSRPGS